MLLIPVRVAPSPIHGLGTFAIHPIPQGTPIWQFTPGFDVLILADDAEHLRNQQWLDTYTQRCPRTGCLVLDADDARFMNHSDNPNVDTLMPLWDPDLIHRALRDIAAGDELTCDYRIGDAEPFRGFDAEKRFNANPKKPGAFHSQRRRPTPRNPISRDTQ